LNAKATDQRDYPARPFLAVSAAIFRDDRVLIVRREKPPAKGVYTLPGGVVEAGETLQQAVAREVHEETGLTIETVALAGYREALSRDAFGRVERHFVILPFAARWVAGEVSLNQELGEARWLLPSEVTGLAPVTAGLADIIAAAGRLVAAAR